MYCFFWKAEEGNRNYQTQKIKELLALIEQNPTLPVVPMVASEIVCDDSCARWKGSWGAAEVTKYICGEEHIFFFDDSDMGEVENTLTEVVGCDWCEEHNTNEEWLEKYRGLGWTECIAVNINEAD